MKNKFLKAESLVDRDIVYAKVATIQRCLRRIKDATGIKSASLDDLDTQEIFILNLQRAAQSAIDLAAHVVASEGFGVPQDLKENFSLLAGAKIIPDSAAEQMKKMVGFRNIAVHEYQNLNSEILKQILMNHLRDLEFFYTRLLEHFKLTSPWD